MATDFFVGIVGELIILLIKADNKLDEYGEPDKGELRTAIRKIIALIKKRNEI